MTVAVDVLIPTFGRPTALAITLTSLAAQTHRPFRIIVSDQTPDQDPPPSGWPEIDGIVRVLEATGRRVVRQRHLPRRGLAEHRQALLDRVTAPFALYLDDDVILEPDLLERLVAALERERCGFIGCGLIGLSHRDDIRPGEQQVEFWDGPVRPERVVPGSAAWGRHRLHNAANLAHLAGTLGEAARDRLYRVAWIGGCVLYDVAKLRAVGGFGFWRQLPEHHAGEDALAQLRVMARYGGAGLFPSGAYHLELPTTVADRGVDAPWALSTAPPRRSLGRRSRRSRRLRSRRVRIGV